MNKSPKPKNGSRAKNPKPKRNQSKKTPVPNGAPVSREVDAPVARGKVIQTTRAKTTTRANGDIAIRHREYVQDIAGSVAFAAVQQPINPGLAGLFPWLSTIAPSFESYRFNMLKFCFETESPTDSPGTLLLVVDYDASDPAPVSKAQAMAYRGSVRSPPWAACCHTSLKEDLSKRKTFFVRRAALAANEDVKLYDTGNLFVCTQAEADASAIGELYVEYDVELLTPQIGDIAVGEAVYGEWAAVGTSNAAPFGASGALANRGNLPALMTCTGTTTSVTTWTFTQPWSGVVAGNITGSTLVNPAFGGTGTIVTNAAITNTAANQAMFLGTASFQVGQTLTITLGNASINTAAADFGQGSF